MFTRSLASYGSTPAFSPLSSLDFFLCLTVWKAKLWLDIGNEVTFRRQHFFIALDIKRSEKKLFPFSKRSSSFDIRKS